MSRYKNIDVYSTENNKKYYTNAIYPAIPESEDDLYIIPSIADRYDTLAKEYYGDSALWWIIASANKNIKASLFPVPGQQLRIPANKNIALSLFDKVNKSR